VIAAITPEPRPNPSKLAVASPATPAGGVASKLIIGAGKAGIDLAKEMAVDSIDPFLHHYSGLRDSVVSAGTTMYNGATQIYNAGANVVGQLSSVFKWPP
jgi:hypothetical protein